MRSLYATLVAFIFAIPLSAMTLTFSEHEVIVDQVTPGGAVAWNSVLIEPYNESVLRWSVGGLTRDDDSDGRIAISIDREIPARSVWSVIDVSDGSHVIGSPKPGLVNEFDIPRQHSGRQVLAGIRRDHISVLVVRPNEGAWRVEGFEGGLRDSDRNVNATLSLQLDSMQSLTDGGSPLKALKPGDVIIVFDARTFEHAVVTLGR